MKKAFLTFMEQVMDIDCPFFNFNVNHSKTFIDVIFVIAGTVSPEDLGWLNTHLVGGRWFITSEGDSIRIVVRFHEESES